MTHVRRVEHRRGEPPDGNHAPTAHELVEERTRPFDLRAGRPAVRSGRAGVRRHDVPQQHGFLDAQLARNAVHDRRARFRRPRAGELTLGCECNPADARAAITGRLTHEDRRSVNTTREVRAQPVAAQLGAGVLVVRGAHSRTREPLDEVGLRYSHSMVAGGFDVTSSTTRFTPGISFTILLEIVSIRSYGRRAQSAVIASSLVTARITIG